MGKAVSENEKQKHSGQKEKEVNERKSKNQDVYECPFCLKVFNKGQKLGGHMSRNHPQQSEKYKEKIAIRNKRSQNRKLLAIIKGKFFKKHNIDLTKLEKKDVQMFLKENKNEYLQFKKHEHKNYKLHVQEHRNVYLKEHQQQMNIQTESNNNSNTENKDLLFKVKRALSKESNSS